MKYKKPIIIDHSSLADIRLKPQLHEAISKYYWDHYSYFAHSRSLIFDELKTSLRENTFSCKFDCWQRVTSYQFSLTPLSAIGSALIREGGRFNYGTMDQSKFTPFPALYLAETRDVAYKEKYALFSNEERQGITSDLLHLTKNFSGAYIAVRGEINHVLEISKENLKDFFNLIKDIKAPRKLRDAAKRLNINFQHEVKTLDQLIESILIDDWRNYPQLVSIPSNSQIIGHIAYNAGIEAILYPSKMDHSKKCLAVFPGNFKNSNSFIEIIDRTPDKMSEEHKRLDSNTFKNMI